VKKLLFLCLTILILKCSAETRTQCITKCSNNYNLCSIGLFSNTNDSNTSNIFGILILCQSLYDQCRDKCPTSSRTSSRSSSSSSRSSGGGSSSSSSSSSSQIE
jgi:uncharacterized membrane protein YgcG